MFPRAHQDIEHSLDAQVITESQSVIEYDGCRTPLRKQKFRKGKTREHRKLFLRSVAEAIERLGGPVALNGAYAQVLVEHQTRAWQQHLQIWLDAAHYRSQIESFGLSLGFPQGLLEQLKNSGLLLVPFHRRLKPGLLRSCNLKRFFDAGTLAGLDQRREPRDLIVQRGNGLLMISPGSLKTLDAHVDSLNRFSLIILECRENGLSLGGQPCKFISMGGEFFVAGLGPARRKGGLLRLKSATSPG